MTVEAKLFRFTRRDHHWRYVALRDVHEHDEATWAGADISHTAINEGGDSRDIKITITLPRTLPVAANWHPYAPSDPIIVTVWTLDMETDHADVDWIGRIIAPRFRATTLELTSEPNITTARRGGKGRIAQRGCDHLLYSRGCGVDPAGHELPFVIDGVSGHTITSSAFLALPSGRLAGGYIEWVRADGLPDWRSIDSHSGSSIVVDYGAQDLAPLLAGSAYPGCGGDWESCGYYGNQNRFGGFPHMPVRDYYDGNPV